MAQSPTRTAVFEQHFDDLTHRRAVTQARIHLANMPAERRAQLEREWKEQADA